MKRAPAIVSRRGGSLSRYLGVAYDISGTIDDILNILENVGAVNVNARFKGFSYCIVHLRIGGEFLLNLICKFKKSTPNQSLFWRIVSVNDQMKVTFLCHECTDAIPPQLICCTD